MPPARAAGAGHAAAFDEQAARPSLRSALYVGFGAILLLWILSGADLVRRLTRIEEGSAAASARFTSAGRRLTTVRVRVLRASVLVRDALFDTAPDMTGTYLRQIESARDDVAGALEAYVPVSAVPEERQAFRQLEADVQGFWRTIIPVLDWDERRRSDEAWKVLREQVAPKREAIARILRRLQGLNRTAFEREQNETRVAYAALRTRIWLTSGAALVASLVVALVVTRYASGLERQIRAQLVKDAENTRNLQRLSARLVNAQEDERRTIARELHDEVGQALTAVKVELSVAGRKVGLTASEGEAFLEARRLADLALQQVRDLSQLLHPAMLDDLGLPDTIAWYLGAFSARAGIRAEFAHEGMDERLAGEIETCLYRIVQEAVTNVARHADASWCRVSLQRLPAVVRVTIEDDGRGFDPGKEPAAGTRRGLGLLGIEERVSGFNGSMNIETSPGAGTRLTIELPALPREGRGPDPAAQAEDERPSAERT